MASPFPNVEEVALRSALERNALDRPDEEFLFFDDGTVWTRLKALEIAAFAANSLRAAGVRQGDRVALLLPNGEGFLRAWWGSALLGATVIPINTSLRGSLLRHLLSMARPVAFVSDDSGHRTVEELGDLDGGPRVQLRPDELVSTDSSVPVLERSLRIDDPSMMILTSGTTGPSKLVPNTHLHSYIGGSWFAVDRSRGREDLFQIDLPLFHAAAMYMVSASVAHGVRISLRTAPDLRNYWEILRDTGATMGSLISTMVPFLLKQPVRAAEREHRLRTVITSPPPADLEGFMARFNLAEAWTGYGMTELPSPIVRAPQDTMDPGYCGRTRPGFETRIVDEYDIEVAPGETGELIARCDQPWVIAPEYLDDPEATARTWRNGWFHTGDMMRCVEGRYYFVDRLKDVIRRRGENISSAELEAELRTHPLIAEVACVPHRPEGIVEDEVKAWIIPVSGETIDFEELLRYAADRLPHFMVPRYFEIADELPKTPSQRVKKFELCKLGNSKNTWDREAHGLTVTRSGLRTVEPIS